MFPYVNDPLDPEPGPGRQYNGKKGLVYVLYWRYFFLGDQS